MKTPYYSNELICPTPDDSRALNAILGTIPGLWVAQSAPQAAGFVSRYGAWDAAPIDALHQAWEAYVEGKTR